MVKTLIKIRGNKSKIFGHWLPKGLMLYKILMGEPVGQHLGGRTTYVCDGFPHKDFIGHRPLWEPMPKSMNPYMQISFKITKLK